MIHFLTTTMKMSFFKLFCTSFAILFRAFWVFINQRLSNSLHSGPKPPPGPLGLPLIGHLYMLSKLPHRSLYKLSQKHGPIMSLRLGSVPAIIVTSPAAAELFLKTHETVFASRPKSMAADYLAYGSKGMAFTEYGAYWRNVRKFCKLELLSNAKITSMAVMRREELELLVESLKKAAGAGEVVDVTQNVSRLIEDMTCRMLFGKKRDYRSDFREILQEFTEITEVFNIAEYIPFLGAFDLQGLNRRLRVTRKTVDRILETIIADHEQDAINSSKKLDGDFVDVILSLKNHPTTSHEQLAHNIDLSNIKAIILDMIFGATETSQTAIEWIMTELIRHQRVMKLLQEEIKSVTLDNELVEESHLSGLDYLDMVVMESMRLHPVAPLLIPRESMKDVVIDGHYIPNKSRIIINTWGIGRDPKIWSENVEEFLPERFRGSNINFAGKNVEVIPFGLGRRGCPGRYLGLVNIKLVVAQLVHSFDWELPFGMSSDELNMDEVLGLTMPRAKHLLAMPSLRTG